MKPAGRRPQPDDGQLIDIEVIDADPSAFEAPLGRSPARSPRARRKWLAPIGVTVAVAAVATLLIFPPWRTEPELRTYPVSEYPIMVELGALAFAEPPGAVVSAQSPTSPAGPSAVVGYLFAAPGATYDTRDWVLFQASSSSAANSAPATVDAAFTVHGVEADFTSRRFRHTVTWGPLAGYRWRVDSNLLSDDETLQFAAAVAVSRGAPATDYDLDLGSLRPVASAAAFERAVALRQQLLGGGPSALPFDASLVSIVRHDGESAVQLASVPAPLDALAIIEFMFGGGRGALVHGLPAVLISRQADNLVVWYERGLLVAVSGSLPADELLALAESVGPVVAV